jgi:hypothetical protein
MADDISTLITDRTETIFWAKVDRRGPDECWPWQGSADRRGYGQVMLRDHRPRRAHHLALHFDGRPRPGNLHCLHSCDNPSCCNPAHLRWGTIAQNAKEKSERGRCPDTSGERNAHHKLTEDQVREIRSSTETHRALAAKYGLSSHRTIGRIKRHEKWRCIE